MEQQYESYKQCERRLTQLMEEFSREAQTAGELLSQMRTGVLSAQEKLAAREKNVFQMESSIRKRMDTEAEQQERLNNALQSENAAVLKQQLLQEELETERSKRKNLEERAEEISKKICMLEKKVTELSLANQNLSKDKTALLQAQVKGGII